MERAEQVLGPARFERYNCTDPMLTLDDLEENQHHMTPLYCAECTVYYSVLQCRSVYLHELAMSARAGEVAFESLSLSHTIICDLCGFLLLLCADFMST